ncbi:MAG: hypothetical protein P4L69_05215 [Desulfosporosinus sp.]|nr:hypothetical protein [Desulfosporosinus sp.]
MRNRATSSIKSSREEDDIYQTWWYPCRGFILKDWRRFGVVTRYVEINVDREEVEDFAAFQINRSTIEV